MPVPDDRRRTTEDGKRFIRYPSSVFCRPNSIDRKTSLLRDRPEDACGQAASWMWIAHGFSRGDFFGSIPSSRCQTTRAPTPVGRSRRRAARETCFLRTSRRSCWWSQTGSNRRPPACKAGALPTELWPRSENGGQTTDDRYPSSVVGPLSSGTGGPGKI